MTQVTDEPKDRSSLNTIWESNKRSTELLEGIQGSIELLINSDGYSLPKEENDKKAPAEFPTINVLHEQAERINTISASIRNMLETLRGSK